MAAPPKPSAVALRVGTLSGEEFSACVNSSPLGRVRSLVIDDQDRVIVNGREINWRAAGMNQQQRRPGTAVHIQVTGPLNGGLRIEQPCMYSSWCPMHAPLTMPPPASSFSSSDPAASPASSPTSLHASSPTRHGADGAQPPKKKHKHRAETPPPAAVAAAAPVQLVVPVPPVVDVLVSGNVYGNIDSPAGDVTVESNVNGSIRTGTGAVTVRGSAHDCTSTHGTVRVGVTRTQTTAEKRVAAKEQLRTGLALLDGVSALLPRPVALHKRAPFSVLPSGAPAAMHHTARSTA